MESVMLALMLALLIIARLMGATESRAAPLRKRAALGLVRLLTVGASAAAQMARAHALEAAKLLTI